MIFFFSSVHLPAESINKNPETETGVQLEGQKSKTPSHWLLPLLQSEMATCLQETSDETVTEILSSCIIILSSSGIKLPPGFYGKLATGIKGVCHRCL